MELDDKTETSDTIRNSISSSEADSILTDSAAGSTSIFRYLKYIVIAVLSAFVGYRFASVLRNR